MKIYVGITDDQPQIPTHSPNQPVFLSFDPLMQDNYLLYDKKWRTVPEEFVVFGPEYETVESRKKAALELLWNGVLWIGQQKLLKREAFIKWTLERLRWEAKFLEREWFIRGNREIFPPDTHHRQQGPGGHPRARADGALPAAAQLDFSIHDFSFSAFFFSASSLSIGIHLYKTRDVDLKMAKNDVDDAKSQTKRSENTTRRAETPTGRPSASRPIDLGFPPALPRLPSRSSSAVQPVQANPPGGPNWIPTRTPRSLPDRPEQQTNKEKAQRGSEDDGRDRASRVRPVRMVIARSSGRQEQGCAASQLSRRPSQQRPTSVSEKA